MRPNVSDGTQRIAPLSPSVPPLAQERPDRPPDLAVCQSPPAGSGSFDIGDFDPQGRGQGDLVVLFVDQDLANPSPIADLYRSWSP